MTTTDTGVGPLPTPAPVPSTTPAKAVTVRAPSTVPSWLVSVGSAVAAGLTTAGYGHLGTPIVAVIDAVSGILVALHVHVALPKAVRAAEPRIVSALKALVD